METKTVKDTSVSISLLMQPQDANPAGIVHGGVIMKEIDNASGVVAVRHSRKIAVTASIDRIDFHNKVFVGNYVTVQASINRAGRSSMEIGARVEAEDLLTGEVKHIASAYLTFVALGLEKGESVPELLLETPDEKRRNIEARARRKTWQALKKLEESNQAAAKEAESMVREALL